MVRQSDYDICCLVSLLGFLFYTVFDIKDVLYEMFIVFHSHRTNFFIHFMYLSYQRFYFKFTHSSLSFFTSWRDHYLCLILF